MEAHQYFKHLWANTGTKETQSREGEEGEEGGDEPRAKKKKEVGKSGIARVKENTDRQIAALYGPY